MFSRETKLSFPSTRKVFSVLKLAAGQPGIYLLRRKCSVRRSVTNNKLENTPQTSTVFYLAERNYFSAQSICNWHWLNKKLQPLKALFIISCKSADFAVNYPHKGLWTINTAQGITQAWQPGPLWGEDWKGSPPLETLGPFHCSLPLQLWEALWFSLSLYLGLADARGPAKRRTLLQQHLITHWLNPVPSNFPVVLLWMDSGDVNKKYKIGFWKLVG